MLGLLLSSNLLDILLPSGAGASRLLEQFHGSTDMPCFLMPDNRMPSPVDIEFGTRNAVLSLFEGSKRLSCSHYERSPTASTECRK